jgi:hypothetical protein
MQKPRPSSVFTTFKTPTFPVRIQAAPGRLFAVNTPGFFKNLFKNRKARKKEPTSFKPILSDEETGTRNNMHDLSLVVLKYPSGADDTLTSGEREFKYFSDPTALETQPALLRVNERVGRVVCCIFTHTSIPSSYTLYYSYNSFSHKTGFFIK